MSPFAFDLIKLTTSIISIPIVIIGVYHCCCPLKQTKKHRHKKHKKAMPDNPHRGKFKLGAIICEGSAERGIPEGLRGKKTEKDMQDEEEEGKKEVEVEDEEEVVEEVEHEDEEEEASDDGGEQATATKNKKKNKNKKKKGKGKGRK
jgi:hypothetical protein